MAEHIHPPEQSHISSFPSLISASDVADRMAVICANFLETLTPNLRQKAEFPFDEVERRRWHYFPRENFERKGLSLKEMNDKQKAAAFELLRCGLSQKGYQKARAIIDLEITLGELERLDGTARFVRTPNLYYFSVFGDTTNREPWGWRTEGHHISVNFTVVNRELVSPTPFFFGSNPAQVQYGPKTGLRILSAEEDIARQLLDSLNSAQKKKTVISTTAPRDIITKAAPKIEFESVEGLAAESMTTAQRDILMNLVRAYIDRLPDTLATIEIQKLRHAGANDIHFAWAGEAERGEAHYYRIHGPSFFVEYDNTQNDANHIHSVWRHLEDDFGLDLLRLHYQYGHRHV